MYSQSRHCSLFFLIVVVFSKLKIIFYGSLTGNRENGTSAIHIVLPAGLTPTKVIFS